MDTRITIDQLERMKTHEVADLLSNVVLLLKRMPNVECRQFTNDDRPIGNGQPKEKLPEQHPDLAVEHKGEEVTKPEQIVGDLSTATVSEQIPAQTTYTVANLAGKNVAQLRQIAKDLNLPLRSGIRKDELIAKLTARLSRSHSEQYEIQNII